MSELTRPVPAADGLRRIAAEVLSDLRAVDGALYAAVAATPTPALDRALRRLSHAADHPRSRSPSRARCPWPAPARAGRRSPGSAP